ncbi:MAG: hypothetical protein ACLUJV_02195 [Blautia producta]
MKTIIIKENGTETVSYEFSETDLVLLKKPLPDAPCLKCKDTDSCCGCPEYNSYKKMIQPYEDNGIFDLAFALGTMISVKKKINELQEKYEAYEKYFPPEIRKLIHENARAEEEITCSISGAQ